MASSARPASPRTTAQDLQLRAARVQDRARHQASIGFLGPAGFAAEATSFCSSPRCSRSGSAHGGHRHVLPGRPPPCWHAHGVHQHVPPGRLHSLAPLMALVGLCLLGLVRYLPAPSVRSTSVWFSVPRLPDGPPSVRPSPVQGRSSAWSFRSASPTGSAHGGHRHVLPGQPPPWWRAAHGAHRHVLPGRLHLLGAHRHVPRGRLTCRPRSWRSSACSPRAAPAPWWHAHGAHRRALPGQLRLLAPLTGRSSARSSRRLHQPAPLMAVIGMFFRDGFPCRPRSWRSSACPSRTALLCQRRSWCSSAFLPGRLRLLAPRAAQPIRAAASAQHIRLLRPHSRILPHLHGRVRLREERASPGPSSSGLCLLAPLTALNGMFFQGPSSNVRDTLGPEAPRVPGLRDQARPHGGDRYLGPHRAGARPLPRVPVHSDGREVRDVVRCGPVRLSPISPRARPASSWTRWASWAWHLEHVGPPS